MNRHIKIDLFTDVVCPWCLVGSVRLDKAIARLPKDVTVEVENHPFYLDPDTPEQGVDVGQMLEERYHRPAKEMWARVEAEAASSGVALDLSRQPRMFPTRKAHTITRLAKPYGRQHELANAIAEAYFLEHLNINDDEVLAGIASRYGFAREEALRLMRDPVELAHTEELALAAAQQGIRGVPFFVFDGRFALSGAQPEEVFERAFEQLLAQRAPAQ